MTKRFPGSDSDAVSNLDLEVESGSIVSLLGPSGCGKTTTLRMINRMIEPTSGVVEIDGFDAAGQPVTELRRSMGYVIQQVGLFPHRTVESNIAAVPRAMGWERRRINDRVWEVAETVGIEPQMLRRYPDELSGGQQQRVGVARALAADPPILLMDEPFGAVDPIVRARLQDELLDLQSRLRKTIILVTHDLDEATKLSDRIALMNVGGRLEQFAAPDELLHRPASPFVKAFVGESPGIRRLGLAQVRDLEPSDSAAVTGDTNLDRARSIATERGGWVGVVEDDRFRGWASRDALDSTSRLDQVPFEAPVITVSPGDTLRTTIEAIMNAETSMVVIEDEGIFRGTVSIDDIRRHLHSPPDGDRIDERL